MGRSLRVVLAAVVSLTPVGAMAQPVGDFYRGKTVSLILGYPGGGSNGIYARAVARHLGRHIPGNPTVIFRSMPGAGSLIAANHLFNVAPKDGTALGFISATIPLEELLGVGGAKFKSAEFNWIGRVAPGVNMTFVKDTSPVKRIEDVYKREVILGASGRSSTVAIYPAVLANVVGAKFKLVMGYSGSPDAMLAMERGEVEGHSTTWDGVKSRAENHLRNKTINILVQHGIKRHPELPDVPTSVELGRTPDEVEALRVFANASDVGRFIFSTPDTPADRIQALRRAFDAMVKDPEFMADLKTQKLELGPLVGEELQKLVAEVATVSPAIIERVRGIYSVN
jgi:tripartite-type tricarboxylate transporter receptor subunit TctC